MPNELAPYTIFLTSFILINVFIYFVIQLNAKEKVFRQLFYYWLSVLFVLVCESFVKEGKLALSLIFLVNFIPITIGTTYLTRVYGYKIKYRFYVVAIPLAVGLTIFFNSLNLPFTVICAPIFLVDILPFVEALYVALISKRSEFGIIEKMIGGFLSVWGIISCVAYLLYRYNPTLIQYVFGFGSAFVGYLMYSILLPLYSIQQINRKRTEILEAMVADKTKELVELKNEKEKLLRVLVHDISNPLQSAMFKVSHLKSAVPVGSNEYLYAEKVSKGLNTIKDIVSHVREYECVLLGLRTLELEEVFLQECLDEVENIFSDRYKEKNIQLNIHNKLPSDTKIKVDRTSFILSVASNLISNAFKFSKPNSEVQVLCYEKNSEIIIEVIDNGVGMNERTLSKIFDIGASVSSQGTLGEKGTGFGLPIVKAYVTMFGGRIMAKSSQDENNSGTTFSLHLPHIQKQNNFSDQKFMQ